MLLSLLYVCLAQAREIKVAWQETMAERMYSAPPPYEFLVPPRLDLLPHFPEPWDEVPSALSRERRWFEMEDSADWLGLVLGSWATAGLQVEYTGPAEESKRERRMINMRWDPFHPVYVQATAGLRIRF